MRLHTLSCVIVHSLSVPGHLPSQRVILWSLAPSCGLVLQQHLHMNPCTYLSCITIFSFTTALFFLSFVHLSHSRVGFKADVKKKYIVTYFVIFNFKKAKSEMGEKCFIYSGYSTGQGNKKWNMKVFYGHMNIDVRYEGEKTFYFLSNNHVYLSWFKALVWRCWVESLMEDFEKVLCVLMYVQQGIRATLTNTFCFITLQSSTSTFYSTTFMIWSKSIWTTIQMHFFAQRIRFGPYLV